MTRIKYSLIYDEIVVDQIRSIDKKFWQLIKQTIEDQLSFQPNFETKNRKPLIHPPIDDKWEIRFGPNNMFRVFCTVHEDTHEVWIHMVAKKINNKLYIGEKEIEL